MSDSFDAFMHAHGFSNYRSASEQRRLFNMRYDEDQAEFRRQASWDPYRGLRDHFEGRSQGPANQTAINLSIVEQGAHNDRLLAAHTVTKQQRIIWRESGIVVIDATCSEPQPGTGLDLR